MNSKIKFPVLVIDDEDDLRELIQMTLVKMGLEVDTASGVREARAKLEKNPYSLVLTDMRMPDGTGLEVVEFINDSDLDTPVAVITAYGNADNAVEALKRGAFDYLQKPITLAQLRTLVKSAIKIDEEQIENHKSKPAADVLGKATPLPPLKKKPSTQKKEVRYGEIDFDFSLLDEHTYSSDKTSYLYRTNNPQETLSTEDSSQKPVITEEFQESTLSFAPEKTERKAAPIELTEAPREIPRETFVEEEEPVSLKKEKPPKIDLPRLLGESIAMQEVKDIIVKLSNTMVPVYISGESGTGKEQAARSIHELSERKEAPFVPVNCGAIPENLMESEFFGYKKGSFTGADADKEGFFQHANKGTIFLDEVADLPLAMQVKLLRVIQEKMVRKIGENKETAIDVRILCATHKNLEKEVEEGRFRQDLYYRLNVITLIMPPLRELKDDLPKLIRNLLKKFSANNPIQVSPESFKMLLNYDYPGNFRELENILERAVALSTHNNIKEDDLQLRAVASLNNAVLGSSSMNAPDVAEGTETEIDALIGGRVTLQDLLDKYEKNILIQGLERAKHNRTQAAKLMGISFRSIRYRLERLGIE